MRKYKIIVLSGQKIKNNTSEWFIQINEFYSGEIIKIYTFKKKRDMIAIRNYLNQFENREFNRKLEFESFINNLFREIRNMIKSLKD